MNDVLHLISSGNYRVFTVDYLILADIYMASVVCEYTGSNDWSFVCMWECVCVRSGQTVML